MQPTSHEFSIMSEHYLNDIMLGKKKYEGRVNTEKYRKMHVGDTLKLYEHEAGWGIVCRITSLTPFSSFKDMLETLGVLNLLPQLEPLSQSVSREALLDEAIRVYTAFPGSERVHSFGCVAIGVIFLQQY
ncbi:MAG: hypothetical protein JSR46_08240 [Verrucomicrobia bacterium]|nr:hypothetical protein [Verrucomicrobiota bacterium]